MKHKARVLAIGLTIVVVAAIAFIVTNRPFEKVYGEVAGHKIYQAEVDAMKKTAPKTSISDVVSVLLDKYFLERLISDNHITVSQQDIQNQINGETGGSSGQASSYLRQNVINMIYRNELKSAVADHYAGRFIIAHFDQRITTYKDDGTPSAIYPGGAGDPKAIAQDRQNATTFINAIYQQITSGKLSFDAAITKERQDPTVGADAIGGVIHSGSFNSAEPRAEGSQLTTQLANVQSHIVNLKPGEISKPFVGQENMGLTKPKMVDAFWMIIRLDEIKNDHISFDQYIAQAKQRLGYHHA